MNFDYKTTFDKRGNSYHEAMLQFPTARYTELENVFSGVDKSQLRDVLDIPSAGGYLQRHLPDYVRVHAFDPSLPFTGVTSPIDLESPELPADQYDLAVSLAAVHHIHHKHNFLQGLVHSVHDGGTIVIGDVDGASPIAGFLDDFVGKHNRTGHAGEYLSGDPEADFRPSALNLTVVSAETRPCNWTLPTVEQLTSFCKLLFYVCDASDEQLQDALERYIGIEKRGDSVVLKWELVYYTFRK